MIKAPQATASDPVLEAFFRAPTPEPLSKEMTDAELAAALAQIDLDDAAPLLFRALSPAPIPGSIATAGGYRNNCGLHAVMHTWFALPEAKIKELYQSHPIFQILVTNFFRYHQLEGNPSIDVILALNNAFPHPLDREMIWGQVLRETLRGITQNDGDLNDDAYIPFYLLKVLTEQMGATLIVNNDSPNPDIVSKSLPKRMMCDPLKSANWTIEVSHTGHHYSFTYPNPAMNAQHNEHYHHTKGLLAIAYMREIQAPRNEETVREIKSLVQAMVLSLTVDHQPSSSPR